MRHSILRSLSKFSEQKSRRQEAVDLSKAFDHANVIPTADVATP